MKCCAFLSTVLIFLFCGPSPTHAVEITNIRPIRLHAGVNEVPNFAPDGGPITIIQAWRGNGNAHGYHIWMILSPNAEDHSFGIVGIDQNDPHGCDETVHDDPFDGERVIGVVHFAKARVDGRDQSILIEANLDPEPGHAFADHEPVTIRIFQLLRTDGAPGSTPDVFKQILTMHDTKKFCNAELALHQVLHYPLASDYAGPNQVDGCFDDR
jgi:hypothetical protein